MMKVVIADSADLMLAGMKHVLCGHLSAQIVGECKCEAQVIDLVTLRGFDVLILDQTLARNSARFITNILQIDPELSVLINSPTRELRYAMSSLRASPKATSRKIAALTFFWMRFQR